MNNELPDSELDARLTEALAKLPDAPLASNFTSRVMRAVDLEESCSGRKWNFYWRGLWPRIAFATVAVVFAGFVFHQREVSSRRAAIADSVALVAAQPLPSVEALKNFDAIRRMSQPVRADDELLALLQ